MISCIFVQYQEKTCKTMLTSQRKQTILQLLAQDGQVLAAPLAASFGVSEDTIRRDLRELAAEGRETFPETSSSPRTTIRLRLRFLRTRIAEGSSHTRPAARSACSRRKATGWCRHCGPAGYRRESCMKCVCVAPSPC